MTREEAKEVFLNRGFINGFFDGDKWRQSIIVISEWLVQEPCEDAISRQAVLDEINRVGVKGFETYDDYSQLYDFVDTLSSVTSQPKTGHWIRCDILQESKCSECRACFMNKSNFCPNCGAKMQEVEE